MFNTKRKHFLKPSRFIKNALRFNYLRATDAIAPRNWRLQIRAILAEGTLLLNLHILVPDIVHPYAAPQWRLSAPAASRGSRVQGMHAWRTPWCDSFLSRDWPPGPRTLVHVFVTCWNFSFFPRSWSKLYLHRSLSYLSSVWYVFSTFSRISCVE